jgi:hypothetical protein
MIYFIRNDKGSIKIGYSKNPTERLKSLQVNCDGKLSLIGVIRGGKDKEKDLHNMFDNLRKAGEWFKSDDELLDYIARNKIDYDGGEDDLPPKNSKAYEIVKQNGRNFKLARIRRHLTMQQVADQVGVGIRAVSNAESGENCGVINFIAIAVFLGMEQEISNIGYADPIGRKIADDELLESRVRGPNKEHL